MSVLTIVDIRRREFAGFEDPSLPEGMWQGDVESIGDASGDINSALLQFQGAGPADSSFYSLEQVVIFTNRASSGNFSFNVVGMGSLTIAGTVYVTGGASVAAVPVTGALVRDAGHGITPLWLGRQNRAGPGSNLQAIIANVLATDLTFAAWGYRWGPRSINAPGGPSRPLQGMF